jgi:anti-sigma regulatory factor (Ser/Thr protein kinase)
MSLSIEQRPEKHSLPLILVLPTIFLCMAYGLLGLTFVEHPANLMSRCVLMDENLARIWSVAHIEIGVAYLGVFIAMTYYLLRAGKVDKTHIRDLGYAFTYLVLSFALDYTCVRLFAPFQALLIGDAVVMTFTLLVSRQIWFQRLLGIFVPLVFFTCAFGHLMEGLSFWQLTYPANVPWTMVTADIGFAILVNSARFPAFIRGHDLENDMVALRAEAAGKVKFMRDVLWSVTEGRLRLAESDSDLPASLPVRVSSFALNPNSLSEFRKTVKQVWRDEQFPGERQSDMLISVGEAAMNAVVHADGGVANICVDDSSMQIWIRDTGPGIRVEQIPRATLEKGYSTSGTLGHGFWLILQTTDALDLATSPRGTTVVLSYGKAHMHSIKSYLAE